MSHLSKIADQVLTEVTQANERIKTASEAEKVAAAQPVSELGKDLMKIAEDIRKKVDSPITYEDMAKFLGDINA